MNDMMTGKTCNGKDRKMFNNDDSLNQHNSKARFESRKENARTQADNGNIGPASMRDGVASRQVNGTAQLLLCKAVHDPEKKNLKALGGNKDKYLAGGFTLRGGRDGLANLAEDMLIKGGDRTNEGMLRRNLTGTKKPNLGFKESAETRDKYIRSRDLLGKDVVFKFTRPAGWETSEEKKQFEEEYERYEPESDSDSDDSGSS